MEEGVVGLLLLQIIAHLLSDFYLQWDAMVQSKKNKGIKSRYLYVHLLLTFFMSWVLSFQVKFWMYALLLTFLHFFIDLLKSILEKKLDVKKQGYLFFADQILHVLSIFWIVCLYVSNHKVNLPLLIGRESLLFIIAVFLLIITPANHVIINIFKIFEIKMPDVKDLKSAGKLIGITERILILIFIISKHFEAIGFLLAAKSILRYEKSNNNHDKNALANKTEYVLAGTLLSFLIAIMAGYFLFIKQTNLKEIIFEICKIFLCK